jgi:hypothetical protein
MNEQLTLEVKVVEHLLFLLCCVQFARGHVSVVRRESRLQYNVYVVTCHIKSFHSTGMMARDIFFVIGGSGFVGRHIVQQLLDRGDVVHVFDIVQRYHDVPFHSGDISDQASVQAALQIVPLVLLHLKLSLI